MLKVNDELKALIPPLTDKEYQTLEQNIINEGCRDALIVWNDVIVDGHNRFEICQKHGIQYNVQDYEFDSLDDVKVWMIDNQDGRRNLTDGWKFELAQEKKKILAEKGRDKQLQTLKRGNKNPDLSKMDKTEHNTQKQIADDLGWSIGKTARADKVWNKADDDTKEKIKSNEISFNQAYNEIKKEEKKQAKEQKLKQQAEEGAKKNIDIDLRLGDFENVFADVKDGSIDCIITDPPYPYEFIEEWSKLSRFAKRVLKPNGFCIAYSGQMNLPEVINRMNENLSYYWTFSLMHTGTKQLINGRSLFCGWKPILVFQNGFSKINTPFDDFIIGSGMEKNSHRWQQSELELKHLIDNFTNVGDTILEPFAGSGTTVLAVLKSNRNVLGAEIDEQSYNISKKRISEWKS